MNCPLCSSPENHVLHTRERSNGISRRRQCVRCQQRWTTVEVFEEQILRWQRLNDLASGLVTAVTERSVV